MSIQRQLPPSRGQGSARSGGNPAPAGLSRKVDSASAWRAVVQKNWPQLKRVADASKLSCPYQKLVMMIFTPVTPKSGAQMTSLRRLLRKFRYSQPLSKRLSAIYRDRDFTRSAERLAGQYLLPERLSQDEQVGLDWLIVATGGLDGSVGLGAQSVQFARHLLEAIRDQRDYPSAVRVQAGNISAGGHVIFAGQDVNIVAEHYQGSKAALKAYLAKVRSEWNIPTTTIHPASQHHTPTALHRLYTPVDIWTDQRSFHAISVEELNARRHQAIMQDLMPVRESVFELIAAQPRIVITGAAGSGKSSLCRFIVTALAFACDPRAEKQNRVKGLDLLGPSWIHGPILPIYVSLRDFARRSEAFPKSLEESSAQHLLDYIKQNTGNLASHLEAYLTQADVSTHGSLVVLDGLDEVYEDGQRIILQRIIESWADRFETCRIIVTSRTYAYRHDVRWRLSSRFTSAELAPYTWQQIKRYIERWYDNAAQTRPSAQGGRASATHNAALLAAKLYQTIRQTESLWPLARQPLMLAMLTMIHEDHRQLPKKRAELYEKTIELLDRWNIPSPDDKLHEKLTQINLKRMRAALKLIAFELHSEQRSFQRYPRNIKRGRLLSFLLEQQSMGGGLGAGIEDVLEYLATRNGILVADAPELYRFPHLSIQEYLAACALLEFYDECAMPPGLRQADGEGWTFPQNVVALLRHDYARWRNVALFAGAIIADGKLQGMRWQLIDELLPRRLDGSLSEQDVHCISMAAEIWGEGYLKSRTRSQHIIEAHLIHCLHKIRDNEGIDAPERAHNAAILHKLLKMHPA